MLVFILISLLMIFIMMISSFIVLFPNHKFYETTYLFLKYKQVVFSHKIGDDRYIFKKPHSENPNFNVEFNKNDIHLTCGKYLLSIFITYCDPYSLYWLLKFRKWFKKNKHTFIVDDKVQTIVDPKRFFIKQKSNINYLNGK